MTKEQEEAINKLNFHKEYAGLQNGTCVVNKADIDTVLNMLKEKDKELEKKDKIIDLLINKLNLNYNIVFKSSEVKEIIEIYEKIKNISNLSGIELRKECIKQYFERKVEEC